MLCALVSFRDAEESNSKCPSILGLKFLSGLMDILSHLTLCVIGVL